MKFGKDDIGVFVEGASLYSSTEQTFKILEFAVAQGYQIDEHELAHARLDYEADRDDLPYDWYEDLGFALEDALHYLNTQCCDDGVVFTFWDTDFALIDVNGLDRADKAMVR